MMTIDEAIQVLKENRPERPYKTKGRRLPERDRKILKRRLIDGICYEPLAWEFDMSVRQIKNIVYKAEARLFKHI